MQVCVYNTQGLRVASSVLYSEHRPLGQGLYAASDNAEVLKRALRFVFAAKGKKARIGFVADERRINVGLTRARSSLIVVGNGKALKSNEHWKNLINHSKATRWGGRGVF